MYVQNIGSNWQHIILLLLVTGNISVFCSFNSPACHKGIMSLFSWCEQSECQSNCTCLSKKHVCKQICNRKDCGLLYCSSPQTCYQSILVEYGRTVPKLRKMVSHSPITQQDCSQAKCSLMKALRYDEKSSRSFQSCSEGTCEHVYSTADNAKQFCGNCDKMTCTGKHAENCTQLCILGNCKQMVCNAKHCKQLCAHHSTCNMTCGPNTEICDQTCSHGSNCVMTCNVKDCNQQCKEAKSCVKNTMTTKSPSTTKTTTTTTTTTTSTTITTTEKEIILKTLIPTIFENSVEVDEIMNKNRKDDDDNNIVIYQEKLGAGKSSSSQLYLTSLAVYIITASFLFLLQS